MPRQNEPIDPYAAPHAPKEKSGPMLRIAIIALLLVGAGIGYATLPDSDSQGLVPMEQEEAALATPPQQFADAGDAGIQAAPEAAPVAQEPAPAPAPARRAAPQRAPAAEPQAEAAPPPTTEIAPVSPAPAVEPIAPPVTEQM